MKTNIVSDAEYQSLLARHQAFEAWRNGGTCYQTSEVPAGLEFSNDERTKIELYDFVNNPPAKYFAYVSGFDKSVNKSNNQVQITTWTGEILGHAKLGWKYKGGFGSIRYAVRKFKAINGKTYYGTFFESSGNYCRLTMAK